MRLVPRRDLSRRALFGLMAASPFALAAKPSDGVALWSAKHTDLSERTLADALVNLRSAEPLFVIGSPCTERFAFGVSDWRARFAAPSGG